jgi:excinuclease ABC subunit C
VTRQLQKGRDRYFGPFANASSVRQTLRVIKEIFPFRSCSEKISGKRLRPCLEYDIRQCIGPCIDISLKEEYDNTIRQLILFLEGKRAEVVKELKKKMLNAAEVLDFEKAGIIRDQIQAVESVVEGQRIATRVHGEQDVVAFVQDRDQSHVQVFFIRDDKLIGRGSFTLKGTRFEEPGQIMSSFLKQFYSTAVHIPPLVLLQHLTDDKAVIEDWLSRRRGGRVRVVTPQRGNKKKLVSIVADNARQGLEQLKIKQLPTSSDLRKVLIEIQHELDLPALPARMEGYDISNIQGRDAVGSMVVFIEGKPSPSHYRRFRIKTVPDADDYAMLKEVISRRFGRFQEAASASNSWTIKPDLVLIDGGKGQLSAALEAMQKTGANSVPLASLAKEREDIFRPGRLKGISLPSTSASLKVLQHLRDESHRFALGYHHKLRQRQVTTSALDKVPGIGPVRRRQLMKRFGSVQAIRQTPVEELVSAGINAKLVRKIKEYL